MAGYGHRGTTSPTGMAGAQIPDEVRGLVDLLDGETLVRAWRTQHGFLVATNLRCLEFWRGDGLFTPAEWHSGAQYFFFSLRTPRVVHGRYLELEEDTFERKGARYAIAHPDQAATELEDLRVAGRTAWELRRASAAAHPATPAGGASGRPMVVVREIVHEVVKIPCRYCGSLMPAAASRCPMCGAPVVR
jgi:hypothetical protein